MIRTGAHDRVQSAQYVAQFLRGRFVPQRMSTISTLVTKRSLDMIVHLHLSIARSNNVCPGK